MVAVIVGPLDALLSTHHALRSTLLTMAPYALATIDALLGTRRSAPSAPLTMNPYALATMCALLATRRSARNKPLTMYVGNHGCTLGQAPCCAEHTVRNGTVRVFYHRRTLLRAPPCAKHVKWKLKAHRGKLSRESHDVWPSAP